MASSYSDVLEPVFGGLATHETYHLLQGLYSKHPTSRHVPVLGFQDTTFPITQYLDSISASYTYSDRAESLSVNGITMDYRLTMDTYSIYTFDTERQDVFPRTCFGKLTFTYDRVNFTVYKATWKGAFFFDLVFDAADDSVGKKLASEIFKYGATLKDEVWVYQAGRWSADKELYSSIQSVEWDDIVLDATFKANLQRDAFLFFEKRAIYDALNITWKRGILLLGPPGNGKTESIKALLKQSKYPALYVKSFTTNHGPEIGVRLIFVHARKHAPCILVIEDLDALVTPVVRSFFLNELDGLAANHGILTIATTNHPERIDDAIVNRPSRFDVKYTFSLPDKTLRKSFAEKWIAKINALCVGKDLGDAASIPQFIISDEDIAEKIAEKCDGFSFAFLKELFVSFLLAYAHAQSDGKAPDAPEELLFRQIEVLSSQIIETENDSQNAPKSAGGEIGVSRHYHQVIAPGSRTSGKSKFPLMGV